MVKKRWMNSYISPSIQSNSRMCNMTGKKVISLSEQKTAHPSLLHSSPHPHSKTTAWKNDRLPVIFPSGAEVI